MTPVQIEQEINRSKKSRKKLLLFAVVLIFLGITTGILNTQGIFPKVWITNPWEHLALLAVTVLAIISGCIIWIYKCQGLENVRGPIAIFIWIRQIIISFALILFTVALTLGISSIFENPQNPIASAIALGSGVFALVLVLLQWLLPTPDIGSLTPSMPPTGFTDWQSQINATMTALGRTAYRSIIGQPPPTNPNIILPRRSVVEEIYTKLTSPSEISSIVLFGLNGIGKSTIAAMVYVLAEGKYQANSADFMAPPLWLKIDSEVTIADLAGTLCEAYGVTIPDFENFSQSNRAIALLEKFGLENKARLIILDQLDSLLDVQSSYVKTDHPGIQEFLDAINSKQLSSRILITSRVLPKRTHETPSVYLQGFRIENLNTTEGVELLQLQRLNVPDTTQFSSIVERCEGHTGTLLGVSSLLHYDSGLNIHDLLTDQGIAFRWGNIAYNLLKEMYSQLKQEQHELLLAFAIYYKAIPLQAAKALITDLNLIRLAEAFDALIALGLIMPSDNRYYRLPSVVADSVLYRFNNYDDGGNHHLYLCSLHARAAQYYRDIGEATCPPSGHRTKRQDLDPLLEAHKQLCQAEQWQDAYNLMREEGIISDLKRLREHQILSDLFKHLFPLENWGPNNVQRTAIEREVHEIQRALGEHQ